MKRTELKRTSALKSSGSTLKRSLLSKKPRKSNVEINGQKIWSTAKADEIFSKMIRERDGKCLSCFSTSDLECSHFIKRDVSAIRFDPWNCITLCHTCHSWLEDKKQDGGPYQKLIMQIFGPTIGMRAIQLLIEASKVPSSRTKAIVELMDNVDKIKKFETLSNRTIKF